MTTDDVRPDPAWERSLWLVLANLVVTAFMAGLIWTIQLVHYPMFADVGPELFAQYQREHSTRITWIVGPAMVVEVAVAVALVARRAPEVSRRLAGGALVVLGLVHVATVVGSVPAHGILADGFDRDAYDRLLAYNWLRTIGWSLRALLAVVLVHRLARRARCAIMPHHDG